MENTASYIELDQLPEKGSLVRDYYSISFIHGWDECPAKQAVSCLTKSEHAQPLDIGSCVHKFMENKYNPSEENYQEYIEMAHDIEDRYGQEGKKKLDEYIWSAINSQEYTGMKNAVSFETEKRFVKELSPFGVNLPVKMKGFVDRIDNFSNKKNIIDYKTSSSTVYRGDKYKDQLILYKWATNADDTYICFITPRGAKYYKQDFSMSDESRLVDKIFAVDIDLQKSNEKHCYKKKCGYYCKWCPLRAACQAQSAKLLEDYLEKNKR